MDKQSQVYKGQYAQILHLTYAWPNRLIETFVPLFIQIEVEEYLTQIKWFVKIDQRTANGRYKLLENITWDVLTSL